MLCLECPSCEDHESFLVKLENLHTLKERKIPVSRHAKPYVLTNENSPAFWLDGVLWMPLATGVLTKNRFSLLEQQMHVGGGPPTHMHYQDEGFYVMEGACMFNAGGQSIRAGAGTFISIPRETPHSFTVEGDPTRVLNFYLPAGFEMILMGVASPAPERRIPALDELPFPPSSVVEELSREYGQVKVLGLPFVDPPDEHNKATMPSRTNSIVPYSLQISEAPAYWHSDILWTLLASGQQTGGSYSLFEELCPKLSGPSPHTHEQDEMIYLLEGEATFLVGNQTFSARAGAFVFLPEGTVHSFRVDSNTARLLNFYAPAGYEQVIGEVGLPATTRILPPAGLSGRADAEKIAALLERVGMHQIAVPDVLRSESKTARPIG